ncbi:MAG: SDR family NAD(P)-dependent oxidoreductase [Chloroflexi bacterium]|nr:SDR family NAD(P)-dependent oxidoreductase [Chloroflexota bacterium]
MSRNEEILNNLEGVEIAVVGMAGRFPQAENIAAFWQNLANGVESITYYTDDELREAGVNEELLKNPNYVKSGAPIEHMDEFDAAFFGFSPRDAAIMDPQHRHFLEVSWEALEHSGYDPSRFDGAIGVFGGSGHNAYMPQNLLTNPNLLDSVGFFLLRHTSNDKDFMTTRVSYLLNLKGPSINVQTACSTSLVAIHLASQSLMNGECDMALAGGVTFDLPHRQGYLYKEGEIVSPDGKCRAFDVNSAGVRFGSGVGVVVLKRLEDAIEAGDRIHAVVKGTAVNNDGAMKAGYLAPSVGGQAEAIAEAIAIANIDPESISYVETHGTGTTIGDPIEVAALTDAFRESGSENNQFCAIGSVKTNIGHLDTAAGVAGFIKTALSLQNKQIPATLHFSAPNPTIDFENSPFYVNAKLTEWKRNGTPRRAGVSSLGVGGTNAHIILEEAPELDPSSDSRSHQLLLLSAKTDSALDKMTDNLAAHLQKNPEIPLADVAYTLQIGRQVMDKRRSIVANSTADAAMALAEKMPKRLLASSRKPGSPSVVFMFSGQGAQYVNMGRDLYESEPLFQEVVDDCATLLQSHLGFNLRDVLYPDESEVAVATERLQQTAVTQPALFTIEYAMAKLWMSWGIQPAALIGHSIGEYAAACLSGVFSLPDALALVATRGRLMQSLPSGTMLIVQAAEATVEPFVNGKISLAAVNGSALCVLSGEETAVEALQIQLDAKEIISRRLHTSHAFHSHMMEPILASFAEAVQRVERNSPQIPFISNISGKWITKEEATEPTYWGNHIRQGVRFADGLQTLLTREAEQILLEVGPGTTLRSFAEQHHAKTDGHLPLSSLRHPKEQLSDIVFLLNSAGQIWLAGKELDWDSFYAAETRLRVPLPTYPFAREQYWVEPGQQHFADSEIEVSMAKKENLDEWFYQPVWQQKALSVGRLPKESHRVLFLQDGFGFAEKLENGLVEDGHMVVSVTMADAFAQLGETQFQINPAIAGDYEKLLTALEDTDKFPQEIVHLMGVTLEETEPDRTASFYSLLYLAQALGAVDGEGEVRLTAVSSHTHQIGSETDIQPVKALALGASRVIANEFEQISTRNIDIRLPQAGWQEQSLLKQLHAELVTPSKDKVVAYRGQSRWVQDFEAAPISAEQGESAQIRQEGVYLITGGMGGLGFMTAQHLAEKAKAKLVLLGRTTPPPRAEWDGWLESHSPHDKQSRAIRKIQELETAGAEVLVLAADVADEVGMQTAVSTAEAQFGSIHGVIHAAGVLDDGLIQMKTAESAESVLRAKVDGTLVLDAVLADRPLDFFMLYSSVSSFVGLAGQIDYAAANAFLDAFAHQKTSHGAILTLAVNWGAWQEVGMTAALARSMGLIDPTGIEVEYPFFDQWIETDEAHIFTNRYSIDNDWLLAEHRLHGGDALIPGTGYLELLRAALMNGKKDTVVELCDIFFMAPFMLGDSEKKTLHVQIDKEKSPSFVIKSRLPQSPDQWQEHVRGQAAYLPIETKTVDLGQIQHRCQLKTVRIDRNEHQQINFGPRWQNIHQIDYGENEVLVTLAMPDEFADEMGTFQIHPAMLDMATAGGQALINGFDADETFYVPFSYGRFTMHRPLAQQSYSHIRYRSMGDEESETAVFDITIFDTEGNVLVEVENFIMRRAEKEAIGSLPTGTPHGSFQLENPLLQTLEAAILPEEGMQAFDRALSGAIWPQVVVTSQDLQVQIEQAQKVIPASVDNDGAGLTFSRPELSTPFVSPETEMEKKIAGIWKELLGLDAVGINDDFFELGGHSLLLTQAVTRIRKMAASDISLFKLFDAATIADVATVVATETKALAEKGEDVVKAPTLKRVSRDAYRMKRKPMKIN